MYFSMQLACETSEGAPFSMRSHHSLREPPTLALLKLGIEIRWDVAGLFQWWPFYCAISNAESHVTFRLLLENHECVCVFYSVG